MNMSRHTFRIEERRRKVASLLAQSMTEEEIARQLNVDQSTISRDIKVLKHMSQQFVYDLAKSDLAHCYKQCINGIEEVKRKAWESYRSDVYNFQAYFSIRNCNTWQLYYWYYYHYLTYYLTSLPLALALLCFRTNR